MKQITEQELLRLIKNGALNRHIINCTYGLKPINIKIVKERQERIMEELTPKEIYNEKGDE